MTAMLTLYTHPFSRGRIARWMLEETGLPYDEVILDYGTTMKAPEYLAINPMGKVPALRHGDAVVTENAAIALYLGDLVPEVAETGPLAKRMADSAANLAAAQLYASYLQDLQLVASQDCVELLEAVHAELSHRLPRRPQLATKYAKVLSLFEQRAASISEGMAQARKAAAKDDPGPTK